jgi:nitrate reductase delta subunit
MIELVVVSRLLEYPDADLWQHQNELFDVLATSEKLEKADAQALGVFLRDLTAQDLLDAQAAYSELFDRGAPPRCCCLSTCTANLATAGRRWLIC